MKVEDAFTIAAKDPRWVREQALEAAEYLPKYADILSRELYRGERPSGVWQVERAARLIALLPALLDAAAIRSKKDERP